MALAKLGQVRISALNTKIASLPGVKFMMNSGTGTTWTDAIGGVNMTLANGASHNGDYATFDGSNDYATTGGVSAPSWASGFAGSVVDGASFNGSGVTVFLLCRTTSIAGRTICQWENTGDNTKWITRVTAAGYWEFWNCYYNDGVINDPEVYLKAPPADRYNRLRTDSRPYIEDGQWHLIQFSRATAASGYYEKKQLWVDGVQVFFGGTGNVVNGFTDWDSPCTFGKASPTTILAEESFSNFSGDVGMFAVRNRWTTSAEMSQVWQSCSGSSGRRGRTRAYGK